MAKKRKKGEDTSSKNKKRSSENCKTKTNKNNSDNRKLSDFSYPELIVLAATLAYSIAEELDEDDLSIFLVLLELLLIDTQTILALRSVRNRSQQSSTEDVDLDIEDILMDLDEE